MKVEETEIPTHGHVSRPKQKNMCEEEWGWDKTYKLGMGYNRKKKHAGVYLFDKTWLYLLKLGERKGEQLSLASYLRKIKAWYISKYMLEYVGDKIMSFLRCYICANTTN